MTLQEFEPSFCKDIVNCFGFDFSSNDLTIQKKDGSYYTVQEFATDQSIRSHLLGNTTLSLKRYPYTKIFCVDIDFNDSRDELVNRVRKVVSILGKPVFIEKSIKDDGGYHLYFKFKKSVETMIKYWSELPSYLWKKQRIKLETICRNNKLKLPFSEHYQVYGEYDESQQGLIQQQSFQQCIESIKEAEEASFPDVFQEIKQEIKTGKKVLMPSKEEKAKEISWDKFVYGAGERWKNQNRIAWVAVRCGLAEWEYISLCERLDYGSKDMSEWRASGSVEKNLSKIYRYYEHRCYDRFSSKNLTERTDKNNRKLIIDRSERYYISDSDKENLEEVVNYFYKGRKGKCKERFIKDTVSLYTFLLHRFKNLKNSYIKESTFLNGGVFLDRPLLLLIGKELKISNPDVIYKFLKDHKIIKAIKDKNTGWTYCYARDKVHYCQHFVIESISSLVKFFKTKVLKSILKFFEKSIIINILDEIINYEKQYVLEET